MRIEREDAPRLSVEALTERPVVAHIAAAVSYVSVAIMLGAVLPLMIPAMGRPLGVVTGLLLLLVGGLCHALVMLRTRAETLEEQVGDLRREIDDLDAELDAVRAQLVQTAAGTDVKAVVAEVRVLQTLIQRLTTTPTAARAGAPAAKPAPAAPPPPPAAAIVRPVVPRDAAADEATLETVREALRDQRIDLFLQPIVRLPHRRNRYYECFSRIRAPDDTLIAAEQYIEVASDAGLISAIDNMLLFRAIQLCRRTRRARTEFGFFCNMSRHTMMDVEFFGQLVDFLADNAELSQSMVFEFAQRDIMENQDRILKHLEKLRRMRFAFSLDQVDNLDFDAGQLSDLGFKFVKVRADMLVRPDRERVPVDLKRIKGKLDAAEIDLIVERIESEEMLAELLDFGIDYGQGYLFGEPRLSQSRR
jgi:cyclic-di-GMP phosphodiesterase TipF (flagellum assembly factor)